MSDPHLEVPKKTNKIKKCVSFTSETIFPVPEATKNKIRVCVDFGRFVQFSKFSEPQFEIPKSVHEIDVVFDTKK